MKWRLLLLAALLLALPTPAASEPEMTFKGQTVDIGCGKNYVSVGKSYTEVIAEHFRDTQPLIDGEALFETEEKLELLIEKVESAEVRFDASLRHPEELRIVFGLYAPSDASLIQRVLRDDVEQLGLKLQFYESLAEGNRTGEYYQAVNKLIDAKRQGEVDAHIAGYSAENLGGAIQLMIFDEPKDIEAVVREIRGVIGCEFPVEFWFRPPFSFEPLVYTTRIDITYPLALVSAVVAVSVSAFLLWRRFR